MPPKKAKNDSRTAGLLQFFAKQQEKREALQNAVKNGGVDDSCQIVFEKPSAPPISTQKTPEAAKNATKWSETLQKTGGESAGRDWLNPHPIQVGSAKKWDNTKGELLANGFDGIHGNSVFYPIDEPIRGFELNLVKCAATSNCCIALPASAPSSSAAICAMTVFNFLKWFPRCRILLVSPSDSWLHAIHQLGLAAQTTKLTTLTQFKNQKMSSSPASRILLCTSPQCALKVVESVEARQFLDDIRLVLMELRPNECCAKYKPILNALTVKDTFFRCVVLTTATSNTSRRTASITKRQLMITNLQLSDWIEQSETDFSFRNSNIPSGIEVKSWKLENSSREFAEIREKFETFLGPLIDELARDFEWIPSKNARKSIWTDWKSLKLSTDSSAEKLEMAEFLATSYKHFLVDGIVAARNFVKKHANQSIIGEIANKISEILGGFSEFPAKFQILADAVDSFLKMDNHVRGAVLCRDSEQAAEIQNYLEFQTNRVNCMRIVEDGTPSARNVWQISRISTVFHDRKTPKIVIIPVKMRDFIGFSDQFPVTELTFIASISRESLFNFRRFGGAHLLIVEEQLEKLRPEDGRLIVDDGKFASGKETAKSQQKMGAVERYDFKFEPSRLRIDAARLPIRFFFPTTTTSSDCSKTIVDPDESIGLSRLGKTHIEMSSKEHAELLRRLDNTDFSRFQRKKRPFWVLQDLSDPTGKGPLEVDEMDEDQIGWNEHVQYLGDIKSSSLSERLAKYLRNGPAEWTAMGEKRRFQYENAVSDEKRLRHLDRLIRNLDANFDFERI